MKRWLPSCLGKTQPSMEKLPDGLRLLLLDTCTYWLSPLKLNACPTFPALKPAPFINTPLLPLTASLALTSPCHQLTSPEGGVKQGETELTVKTALELVTERATLVTTT